jgi:hypothetical protein
MKKTANYDWLLVYMYDEWEAGHNDHKRGEKVRVLVERFEPNFPKNKIGSANDKKTAIAYLRDDGLIEVVDTAGKAITDPDQAYSTGRMKPTQNSRGYLEKMQTENANKVDSKSGTFLSKIFRKGKS